MTPATIDQGVQDVNSVQVKVNEIQHVITVGEGVSEMVRLIIDGIEKVETRVNVLKNLFDSDFFKNWINKKLAQEQLLHPLRKTWLNEGVDWSLEENDLEDDGRKSMGMMERPTFVAGGEYRAIENDEQMTSNVLEDASEICAELFVMYAKNTALVRACQVTDAEEKSAEWKIFHEAIAKKMEDNKFASESIIKMAQTFGGHIAFATSIPAGFFAGATFGASVAAPVIAGSLGYNITKNLQLYLGPETEEYHRECLENAGQLVSLCISSDGYRPSWLIYNRSGHILTTTRDNVMICKKAIMESIRDIASPDLRLALLEKILDKTTELSQFMRKQCGAKKAKKGAGNLKNLIEDIQKARMEAMNQALKSSMPELNVSDVIEHDSSALMEAISVNDETFVLPEELKKAVRVYQIRTLNQDLNALLIKYMEKHPRNRVKAIESFQNNITEILCNFSENSEDTLNQLITLAEETRKTAQAHHASTSYITKFKPESTLSRYLNKALNYVDPDKTLRASSARRTIELADIAEESKSSDLLY